MTEFRRVTDRFSVAPQVQASDMAEARRQGFTVVVCNRPDGEDPLQPKLQDIRAAAESQGLEFVHAPFQGPPTEQSLETIAKFLGNPAARVLAYCRSGTRSITAWSIAAVASGGMAPDDAMAAALDAGYDLKALKDLLDSVAPE